MKRLLFGSWLVAVLAVFSGCPPMGVVCKPGTVPCGTGCIDPTSDRRNCGACGTACFAGQDCNAGSCACRAGTTACGSDCAVLDYDAKNCGRCGNQCAIGQVCELGACQQSCSMGLTRCGASCLDTSGDTLNCGGCGVVCEQGQRCSAGVCNYPAVAACYWSGQIVGFDPASGVKGPLSDVGTNPAALAQLGNDTLVSDQTDHRIYSAAPTPSGTYAISNRASPAGSVATQMLVDRPYVYVANAGSGSVLVLQEGVDAGVITLDAGVNGTLVLGTVTEIQLGMNTFPQGVAKVGSTLWVPLYGGFGADGADAGQELAKIDVTNPAMPMLNGRVSLKNVDLLAFDGGTPVARPWAITAKGTDVYVALNNLNPDTYVPQGPGLVAKVNTTNDMVSVIDLGATQCLNPQWLSFVGEQLVVSCGGQINYSATFSVDSVVAAGVVVVSSGGDVLPNKFDCSASADVDAGFLPMMPGRFAASNGQVVLTDQNGGRVAILAVTDAGVTEVRGVSTALAICPVSPTSGVANVADVITR
ncbi:MAG: MXAN_6577-like cysteine-rich protein [Archangium sp.]